jgi:rhodanese-related sulfurtransferase
MSSCPLKLPLPKILLEALVIVALAAIIGLAVNSRTVINVFTGKVIGAAAIVADPAPSPEAVSVDLLPLSIAQDELDELLAEGAVLIDARNSYSYAAGHLPGALSLPYRGETSDLSALLALASAETPLITYCSGYGCEDSFKLGSLLLQAGYQDVLVYEGGLPEWQDSGREIEKVVP